MVYRRLIVGFLCLSVIYCTHRSLSSRKLKDYFHKRRALIKAGERDALGGKLDLSNEEKRVNDVLMTWKSQELEEGLRSPETFWAGRHFFTAKPHIEKSRIFQFIRKMPKGASLHSHDTAVVSGEYVFNNITFRDNLYAQESADGKIAVKFFKTSPGEPWNSIEEIRKTDPDFNRKLQEQMTLVRDNPEIVYADVSNIWKLFQDLFGVLDPLVTYKPVFTDYFYQALKELYEDNIRYLELRGILPELYDLEGNTYSPREVLEIYHETSRKFMKDYPDFWGVKFIFAPHRFTNNTVLEEYYDFIVKMNELYPNFIAGFDLVGQEDIGPPLKEFVPSLLRMKQVTKLFFHAGETLWNGLRIDENLVDAVLLNTSRIGHGYAILKHPEVMKMVKARGIALEICPISNQVLGLVRDLRNHPANYLIANDYPVVIAPDDPGFWGAKGVSYDWYMAFMAMSSKHSDLRLLKQLAINSINYSSMSDELKIRVMKKWETEWEIFLKSPFKEL